jgi:hypothetical protein
MAQQTATDDGRIDYDDLHARLADRLQTLAQITPDNYDVEAKEYDEEFGLWSVTISSDEFLFNEGEIGNMHFHVMLGPHGGLDTASYSRTLGSSGDYVDECDTKGRAWRRLRSAIKRAK